MLNGEKVSSTKASAKIRKCAHCCNKKVASMSQFNFKKKKEGNKERKGYP